MLLDKLQIWITVRLMEKLSPDSSDCASTPWQWVPRITSRAPKKPDACLRCAELCKSTPTTTRPQPSTHPCTNHSPEHKTLPITRKRKRLALHSPASHNYLHPITDTSRSKLQRNIYQGSVCHFLSWSQHAAHLFRRAYSCLSGLHYALLKLSKQETCAHHETARLPDDSCDIPVMPFVVEEKIVLCL